MAQALAENIFAVPERVNRLQVEITTGCNLACAGCQRTIGLSHGAWRNQNMKLETFRRVLENAPPANALILQGIGEPTLHVDLGAMIAHARATGKYGLISFNTNALVRDFPFYVEMARIGLNHVSVSIDSLNPVTAEALRSGTDVKKLAEMTAKLHRLFGGMTVSVVLSRRNLPELADLIASVRALGPRFIEFQPLISYSETSDPICLSEADAVTARRIIAEARARFPDMALMPAGALTPNGTRCRRPMRAAYVTVEGYLTPCCTTNDIDLFGQTKLTEMPFAEAWNTPGVTRWLQSFFDKDDAICQGCAFNPAHPPQARATPAPTPLAPTRPSLKEAMALQEAGKLEAAEVAFKKVAGEDETAESLHRLGLIALEKGETARAVSLIEAAVALKPDGRYIHNGAVALNRSGRAPEAIQQLRSLIQKQPAYAQAYLSLAQMLKETGDAQGAADCLGVVMEKANDTHAEGVLNAALAQLDGVGAEPRNLIILANRLRVNGRGEMARRLCERRLSRNADDIAAGLSRAMAALTVVHASQAEIVARRETYARELMEVAERTARLDVAALQPSAGIIGTAKPFFLSYHGEDDRPLQELYGAIIGRLNEARGRVSLPAPSRDGRIRVGFVSFYFTLHSVSKLFAGWMKHLDRARFEVIGYHTGTGSDATSEAIQATCERWHSGQKSATEWVETIKADAPHVLIYLELGMNGTAIELAANRLAPVQAMTWGHPVTSGLKDVDYFLSSDFMEPEDGAKHYREELVRLPRLSIAYDPLPISAGKLTRAQLHLRETATVYVCCQSLFKYRPQDDEALVRIAKAVPDSQFLFIGSGEAAPTRIFKERLEKVFRAAGLNPGHHIVISSPVAFEMFGSLIGLGNVYLDSIGWSGGNTTLEAVTLGLPVITLPTGLMRGRHTFAILKQMGLEEFIAGDLDAYVALAARLSNREEEARARALIAENREKLFGDVETVRALEGFLTKALDKAYGAAPATAAAE